MEVLHHLRWSGKILTSASCKPGYFQQSESLNSLNLLKVRNVPKTHFFEVNLLQQQPRLLVSFLSPAPTTSSLAPQLLKQCSSDLDLMLVLRKATAQPSLLKPNQTETKSGSLLISIATVSPLFTVNGKTGKTLKDAIINLYLNVKIRTNEEVIKL